MPVANLIGPIAETLKAARERKGLSQRALAAKIGVPQSHISKIENAGVDIQTSSLIEIARALDLELALVPRQLLPAVRAMQRDAEPENSSEFQTLTHDNLTNVLSQIASLEGAIPPKVFKNLRVTLEDLRRYRFGALTGVQIQTLLERIANVLKQIKRGKSAADQQIDKEILQTLDRLTSDLRAIRNSLAHGMTDKPSISIPAYQLDTENGDG